MIREIQGKIQKIRARFEDFKEISGAVDVILNRVKPSHNNLTYNIIFLKIKKAMQGLNLRDIM